MQEKSSTTETVAQENALSNFAKRCRLTLWNYLRFSYSTRLLTSAGILTWIRLFAARANAIGRARFAQRAARICPSPTLLRALEKTLIRDIARIEPTDREWDRLCSNTGPTEIAKALILKQPISSVEKGVLFISFETHWMRLLRHADLDRLARDYHLVLAPTWSPPHDIPFLYAARRWPGRLFHLLSSFDDIPAFMRIAPQCQHVPLLSSSWVHPDFFDTSEPVAKEFDIVILANFANYKRHFLLFRALRSMRRDTRVLLLGRRMDGRTAETIMTEARAYGVADRITMKPGLPDREMVRALRSAKVSLMLSGNEGSCVAIVESMFADIPVGLFADAIIGSKAFINDHTGLLLTNRNLGRQLENFIDRHEQYSPRQWVLDNSVSCHHSSRLLNDAIRRKALEWGELWTTDIAALHWRPNPTYVYEDDLRLNAPAYEDFPRTYGCSLLLRAVDGTPIPVPEPV